MINAAGDTVFRGGPNSVTVTAGGTTAPVPVPIHYTGVGSNAASVRIAARDTSVFFTDSIVLTAVAFDSANQPIAGTPIEWTSLDTTRALVPHPNSGKVLGRTQRGPARIRARLVTGQADTSIVRVQPVPGALALLAGNGQSGTAGAALAQPLGVRVTAVDSLGVVGVKVRFTVVSGGGTVDTLVVTDTTGTAVAQLRLGTLAGPDTVRAAVTGLTGSPVTFVATALPGAAKSLAVTVQPGTTPAGSPIAPAVQVAARDTFGNAATAFTGTVTLAIGTNPASGTLSGTTAVAAVAGVATFSAVSINRPGTGYTLAATAAGLAAATTGAFSVVPGAPTRLGFGVQPDTTVAGALLAPAARVLILDAIGNTVTSATDSVTIAFGANPAGGVLAGTLRVAAVAGVADFPSLRIAKAGSGYTLAASATGLTGATSAAFDVTVGAAARLAFTVQPGATVAGVAIAPAPLVTVQDSVGNTVATFTGTVTLAIGTNPASGTLSGTTAVAAVAGVATFSSLAIDKAGAGYTLSATSGTLTGATSAAFMVKSAAAAALVFTTQPTDAVAGAAITPAVVVAVRDALGNVATDFIGTVAVVLETNPGGATLSGTTAVAAVAGVATFSGLTLAKAGTGYTLTAASGSLTAATSSAFTVSAGAETKLAFTVQPSAVVAGVAIAPAVQVTVQDAAGNTVTGSTASIAVAIGTNPSSGTLSGTTEVAVVAGVATFSNLAIDKAGTGYTLTATSTGLTGASSNSFVNVGPAAELAFTVQPSAVVAGVAISPAVQVMVQDAVGNTVTSATTSITVAIGTNPSSGTLSGTTAVAAVAGVATFSNLAIAKAGTGYTLTAAATSLTGATSAAFNVTPGAATKLAFTVQPSNATAGASVTPAVQVTVQDAQGNTVTASTASITVAITSGTGTSGAVLGGTLTQAVVAGVATFADLAIDKAGTGYTLGVTSGELPSVTSSAIAVTPAAASALALVSGNSQIGTVSSGVTDSLVVKATDAFGNAVSGVTVNWSTVTGSLTAASTPTGATGVAYVRWTLGAPYGRQTATASAAGVGTAATFQALAQPAGTTHRWLGTSGDWNTPTNWSAGTEPVAASNVFVPASAFAPTAPTLSASGAANDVVAEVGTTIALGTSVLTVNGSLDVQTVTASTGKLSLAGTAKTMVGQLPAVDVSGRYTLAGHTNVAGTLALSGGAGTGLRVNGWSLVADSLALPNSAVLVMQNAADSAVINHGAWFNGGAANDTAMTAGVLRIRGNLNIDSGPNFAAAGTHRTVLDGSSAQTVTMAGAGVSPTAAHFRHLEIANTASDTGVTFASTTTQVNGDLTLVGAGTGVRGPSSTLTVQGSVNGGLTTRLSLPALRIGGALNQTGTYVAGLTEFFGTGQTIPARPYQNVLVSGRASFTGSTSIAGELRINGTSAAATVNGQTVTIADSLILGNSAAYLFMTKPADTVIVGRDARFNGGNLGTDTMLTAGALRIRGNVNIQGAGYFGAAGTHRTVLEGAAAQTVTMTGAGLSQGSAHFRHLDIRNYSGATPVSFTTPVQVNGALDLGASGTTGITAPAQTLTVVDSVGGGATTTLAVGSLRVGGKLDHSGNYTVGTTEFFGTAQTVPALAYQRVLVSGKVLFGATTTIGKDLTINGTGASATVNGQSVTINDSLVVGHVAGFLLMRNPADVVIVEKDARFDGTNPGADTVLTAGMLRVRGNFSVLTGGAYFNGAGTHRTVLDGSVTQRVSFAAANVGTGGGHFGDLEVLNTATQAVKLLSNIAVQGNTIVRTLNGATPVGTVVDTTIGTVGRTATLAGALYDTAGTRWLVTNTQLSGTPAGALSRRPLPLTLTSNLIVLGTDTLARPLTVTGKVWLNGAGGAGTAGALAVNGQTLTISDSLNISTQGFLVMRNPADSVVVNGHAYFDGTNPNQDTILTAGVLRLRGNLRVQFAPSFAAGGTHRTVLDGSTPQYVRMANPGLSAGQGHFRDLQVENADPNGMRLDSTDVVVTGALDLRIMARIQGPRRLTVQGAVNSASMANVVLGKLSVGGTILLTGSTYTVDTTEFFGGTPAVPQAIPSLEYKGMLVSGHAALQYGTTMNGELAVSGSGARFVLNGNWLRVYNGGLTVTSGGKLVMTQALDSIETYYGLTFRGAATGDTLLTAGTMVMHMADLTADQNGAFTPTGTHRVIFSPNGGLRRIWFPASGAGFANNENHFNRLYVNWPAADTLQMRNSVYVKDTLWVQGYTILASYTNEGVVLPASGVLRVASTAILMPSRAEFGTLTADTAYSGAQRIMPDTAVFLNGGTIGSDVAYDWRSVRVAGGTLTSSATGTVFKGNLVISGGTYQVNASAADSVAGFLRTEGSGTLAMPNQGTPQTLAVRDSAVFAGGTSTPVWGTLRIYGSFVQRGSATSFQASPGHTTAFKNSAVPQTVSFAAPDTTFDGLSSHFGNMAMGANNGVVRLLTHAAVQGTFLVGEMGGATLTGTRTLFARGLQQYSSLLTIDSTLLVLRDGELYPSFSNTTFRNQPANATQFWIRRSDSWLVFWNVSFESIPEGLDGYYVGVELVSGSGLTVNFLGVTPPDRGSFVQLVGSPLQPNICWTAGSSCGVY